MKAEHFELVRSAQERLRGQAHVTPVMTSRTLNRMVGAEVYFKCENLQRIGAFKFRGAYNAISRLDAAQKQKGVVTFSSGNHGQAVALVCQMLGIQSVVVMPHDVSAAKRVATENYGARVMLYDPKTTNREDIARDLNSNYGYTLVPPFDHMDVIAGQGTAAMELAEAVPSLDYFLTPCGGGGLLSGSAIALKHLAPKCRVFGVEPELADDATRSFNTKTLQSVKNPATIADGTRTPCLGKLTFPLVLEYVDGMVTVSENAIIEAVRFLFYRMKLVVEPSGALGLAALLSGALKVRGRVGILLSGGNMDSATATRILSEC